VERMRDALQKILAIAPPSIDASWGSVVEIAEAALLSLSRGREGEHQSAGRDSVLEEAAAICDAKAAEEEKNITNYPANIRGTGEAIAAKYTAINLATAIRSLKQEGGGR
jgi:hypothetical protein